MGHHSSSYAGSDHGSAATRWWAAASVLVPLTLSLLLPALGVPAAEARTMTFLDDGVIRVGVDLDEGGVITYLARSGSELNVINDYDLGRQVQQSYFAGPEGLGPPCPGFSSEWNPIGAGDCHGHPSKVLQYANDGTTIYVKSRPLQWAFDSVPCECTFEHWITLAGNAVQVRNRLTNARSDRRQYPARDQELPAVYTVGTLSHLVTYSGAAPFTGGPVEEIAATLPGAARWAATEHWAANVDASGWGLGVFNPLVTTFIGGFAGTRGVGGPHDNDTGYIAPVGVEILDSNIVYSYEYALILGTVPEIRAYASAHRPLARPDYRFTADRQGWWYVNASDSGSIAGALRVRLDRDDPQLWGPATFWLAEDVPKLVVRAAVHSRQREAQLFWSVLGKGFTEERSVTFSLVPDGRSHAYEVRLARSPAYRGAITGIRLDPVAEGEPRASIDLAYVTAIPDRRTVRLSVGRGGSVRGASGALECPPRCTAKVDEASRVSLLARSRPGYRFERWAGACSGRRARCAFVAERASVVRARFVPLR